MTRDIGSDVHFGGMGIIMPPICLNCKKAGQKLTMLEESWLKCFLGLLFTGSVSAVGPMVKMPPPQWNMPWHIPGNRKSSKIGGELMHLRVPSQSKHCHSVKLQSSTLPNNAKSIACPVPTIPMCVYLWP